MRCFTVLIMAALIFTTVGWADVDAGSDRGVNISVVVNGTPIPVDVCRPFIMNGYTYLPLRVVSEACGVYSVEWKPPVAVVRHGKVLLEIPIGKDYIERNGIRISTDAPALIRDSQTFLPIRPVIEALGGEVEWDGNSRIIDISISSFLDEYETTVKDTVVLDEKIIFKGHMDAINETQFSSDGKRLATGSNDGTVRIWDVNTGTTLQTLRGDGSAIIGVRFCPDGKRILILSENNDAKIWDLVSAKVLFSLPDYKQGMSTAEFSPDGTKLLTIEDGFSVAVRDAFTGVEQLRLMGHKGLINSAVFSPSGNAILTASDDSTARIWNSETGALLRKYGKHTLSVLNAQFSLDGKRILTASADSTAQLLDVNTGESLFLFHAVNDLTNACLTPDGQTVLMLESFYQSGDLTITDVLTGEGRSYVQDLDYGAHFYISPDGTKCVVPNSENEIIIWGLKNLGEMAFLRNSSLCPNSFSFSLDGKSLAGGCADGTVKIWNMDLLQ